MCLLPYVSRYITLRYIVRDNISITVVAVKHFFENFWRLGDAVNVGLDQPQVCSDACGHPRPSTDPLHILTQESEDLANRLTEAQTKLDTSEEHGELFSNIREFFVHYAKNVMDGMLSTQGLRRTTKGKGHYNIQVV